MNASAAMTTLLDEWSFQVQTLAEAPNQADEAISQIHTSFGELHLWYSQNGDLDTANLIHAAYNHALMIYNQSKVYAQTFAMGRVVVGELKQQRDELALELSMLLDAIKRGNESHPALIAFAADIREETRVDLLESETFMDEAVDWATDSLYVRVITTFSRYGLGGKWRAQILVDHLLGKKRMDDEQLTALRAFLDTLS
jgi:hypothetical protein